MIIHRARTLAHQAINLWSTYLQLCYCQHHSIPHPIFLCIQEWNDSHPEEESIFSCLRMMSGSEAILLIIKPLVIFILSYRSSENCIVLPFPVSLQISKSESKFIQNTGTQIIACIQLNWRSCFYTLQIVIVIKVYILVHQNVIKSMRIYSSLENRQIVPPLSTTSVMAKYESIS